VRLADEVRRRHHGAVAQPQTAARRRRSARIRLATWLSGSAVGAAVIALPDSDDRVLSFSRTHGPSLIDAIGMVILVLVWLPVVALLWSQRALLRGRAARLAALLAVVGTALLAIAIGFDLGPVWVAPVALLVGAQVLAVAVIARRT
jgi:hypothetical protein